MIPVTPLVIFAAIMGQATAGKVDVFVSLSSNTFQMMLYKDYSSCPGFKACIIQDLLTGIDFKDISQRGAFSTNYRRYNFGPCGHIQAINLNITVDARVNQATIDCSEFKIEVCLMLCQAVINAHDRYTALRGFQNVRSSNDCTFYLLKPEKKMYELKINTSINLAGNGSLKFSEKNSEMTSGNTSNAGILGLFFGLVVLLVSVAVFIYIAKNKIKLLTTIKQPTDEFCIADHSEVINETKHRVPCSMNVYLTPYGEWDTEGENGQRHRDLYALPAIDDSYSRSRYETANINKGQSQAEGCRNESDYVDVTDHYASVNKAEKKGATYEEINTRS